MRNDKVLREKVHNQLENVKSKYGSQALLHLFKFMVPKSWSQAQTLNCLVEYGLDESNHAIDGGTRDGEVVDFLSLYPEDWMRIASCDEKPRHDLRRLEEKGFIKKTGCHRLKFRRSSSITLDWSNISKEIKKAESKMEEYRSVVMDTVA